MNSNYSLLHSVLCLSYPLYHYWILTQICFFLFYDWLSLTRAIYMIIELELPLESYEDISVHTTEDNDLDSPWIYQKQIVQQWWKEAPEPLQRPCLTVDRPIFVYPQGFCKFVFGTAVPCRRGYIFQFFSLSSGSYILSTLSSAVSPDP